MAKERSINPAAAQRKADKQKEINKSKKNLQQQRNEKLARRNPERVQRQIDELKELEGRGALRPKDKETLTQLERDLKGIRRARDNLGDAAPKFRDSRRDNQPTDARQEQRDRRQNLGKRRRDEDIAQDISDGDGSDTDPEVRSIPMPRDTPPPVPRNDRPTASTTKTAYKDPQIGPDGIRIPHALPSKPAPPPPAQTVYSSAPQLRDLKKEAAKFVPSAVAAQKRRVKGEGRLLEPEEIDKLEKAGYYAVAGKAAEEEADEEEEAEAGAKLRLARAEEKSGMDLDEEFKRFEREVEDIYPPAAEEEEEGKAGGRGVQVEEVEDDGD